MDAGRDKVKLSYAKQIKNSDELRNINCYEYLRILASKIPPDMNDSDSKKVSRLLPKHERYDFLRDLRDTFTNADCRYNDEVAYGDKYTEVLTKLDDAFSNYGLFFNNGCLDHLIEAVYENDNNSLERAGVAINGVLEESGVLHTKHAKEKIKTRLSQGLNRINATNPVNQDAPVTRLIDTLSDNYKPQHTTSMASKRKYNHNKDGPTEIRMGTMAQRHEGKPRISPLFLAWIDLKRRERINSLEVADYSLLDVNDSVGDVKDKIMHVYFNNLGRDRTDIEGTKEKELTLELEKLNSCENDSEKDDELNKMKKCVAVITLPADQGEMDKSAYKKHVKNIHKTNYMEQMKRIAIMDEKGEPKIRDFFISDIVREMVFGDPDNQKKEIIKLITDSFSKLGFPEGDCLLSKAQAQAVYFHFIKYELTNYILDKLQPATFNFSCKDGIDRGGASSAYYNLIKSIELGMPMSKEEFDRALHAASTNVKGRGMNHHVLLVWNAINAYIRGVNANVSNIHEETKIPLWLIEWSEKNAPDITVQFCINQLDDYIKDVQGQLTNNHDSNGKFFKANPDLLLCMTTAAQLKELLCNPSLNFEFDMDLINRSKHLKEICAKMMKYEILDVRNHGKASNKPDVKK